MQGGDAGACQSEGAKAGHIAGEHGQRLLILDAIGPGSGAGVGAVEDIGGNDADLDLAGLDEGDIGDGAAGLLGGQLIAASQNIVHYIGPAGTSGINGAADGPGTNGELDDLGGGGVIAGIAGVIAAAGKHRQQHDNCQCHGDDALFHGDSPFLLIFVISRSGDAPEGYLVLHRIMYTICLHYINVQKVRQSPFGNFGKIGQVLGPCLVKKTIIPNVHNCNRAQPMVIRPLMPCWSRSLVKHCSHSARGWRWVMSGERSPRKAASSASARSMWV